MLTQMRLTLKLHRSATLAAIVGLLALAGVAAVVVSHLRGTGVTTGCLKEWMQAGPSLDGTQTACQRIASEFFMLSEHEAGPLMGPLYLLPLVAGLLAGVALVGREIEERTASIAWSLTSSRLRWLVARLAPIGLLLGAVLVVASIAASDLQQAREPWIDASASFDGYGLRGWIFVAHGLLAFALAALAGAAIGRMLPALIIAGVATFLVLGVVGAGLDVFRTSQITLVEERTAFDKATNLAVQDGSLNYGQYFKLPDGRLLDFSQLSGITPDGKVRVAGLSAPIDAVVVDRILKGSSYQTVEAVEAAASLAFAALAVAGTALVVRRRRPS